MRHARCVGALAASFARIGAADFMNGHALSTALPVSCVSRLT
jgi:hypothetical protein